MKLLIYLAAALAVAAFVPPFVGLALADEDHGPGVAFRTHTTIAELDAVEVDGSVRCWLEERVLHCVARAPEPAPAPAEEKSE